MQPQRPEMTRFRRAVALLMNLLLLQASVLGAAAACAAPALGAERVGEASAAAAPAHHGEHAEEHEGARQASSEGDRDSRHDGGRGPLHCTAAMACASPVLASVAGEVPRARPHAGRVAAVERDAPRYTPAAPETPPPRV